jgi:hypothetical protein
MLLRSRGPRSSFSHEGLSMWWAPDAVFEFDGEGGFSREPARRQSRPRDVAGARLRRRRVEHATHHSITVSVGWHRVAGHARRLHLPVPATLVRRSRSGRVGRNEVACAFRRRFAAWINGRPVVRFNVPDSEIPFDRHGARHLQRTPAHRGRTRSADSPNCWSRGPTSSPFRHLNASLSGSTISSLKLRWRRTSMTWRRADGIVHSRGIPGADPGTGHRGLQ